ncbi:hypothetical protein IKE71_02215 [Candidatus Saccharibacteria bacterium]|nr:hypothetical protein [Candidatus Saccharibacteria bacterium]
MSHNHNLGKINETEIFGRLLRGTIAASLVFALGFLIVPYILTEVSATTASTDVTWAGISLELDPDYAATQGGESPTALTHGDVAFGEVTPTSRDTTTGAYGTQKVAKKTIRVVTNGKYYNVFLSMGDDESNSLKIEANDSDQTIPATLGTWSTPAAFSQSGWGYAVPGSTVTGAGFATLATYNAYDDNLAGSSSDNLTKTGTGSGFYNTGTWAAVPTFGNAQQIWKASNASGFSSGSTFDVYYSLMADASVMSGVYENTIVYTAMASSSDLDTVSTNLSRSEEIVTSGTVETIKIDFTTTETLASNDVKVYLVPHKVFAGSNGYTVNSLSTTDYNQCAVTAVTTGTGAATITCTMPNIGATATGDTIAVAGDNSSLAADNANVKGEYDFWVRVSTMDQTLDYISQYKLNSVNAPAATYIGLQSKRTSTNGGGYYVSTMQEMTTSVCKNTNMWGTGVLTYDSTTLAANGNDARVYDYTGSGTPLASTANASAAIGVGTFLLGDNRETVTSGGQSGTNYKTYLVRRLADGHCWMVQNLDLNLADFTSGKSKRLTSENTNLNTKDIWIPDAKMTAAKTTLEPGPSGGLSGLSVSTYQFQSRNSFGPNLYWGSRYQANTTTDNTGTANNNGLVIANNANSNFARSYNNDYAYLTGTQNVKNVAECAKITNNEAVWSGYCQQNGQIGNAGGSLTSATSSDGTTQDTTWQPSSITSDTATTFTMRGSNYLGDYYNWYAATAETGSYTTTSGNIQDDICPKGWRLPTNSGEGSWDDLIKTTYQLTTSYGYTANNRKALNKIMQLPLSIPFAGNYEWANGALNNRGSNGVYWSSTPYSAGGAHALGMNYGGYLSAQLGNDKVGGFTIRCVAE